MGSFADAVRKQKKEADTDAADPAAVSNITEPPKNSTQALADALKNKNTNNSKPKFAGFKGLGAAKKNSSESCPTSPGVAERTEPKPNIESLPVNTSPEVPSSSVSTVSGSQFVHPEQPSSLSEEQVKAFKDAIAFLHSSLPHKEESPQAMRIVLRMIEEEPFLNELMMPEDCGAMVKVLKTSFGVEIAKKQTRSAKAKKSEDTQNELGDMLSELGADFSV